MRKLTPPLVVHIGGRTLVDTNNVAYFEACSNYTIVHLHSTEKLIVATTLGKIEDRVATFGCFVRPHRGLLINAHFVKSFDLGSILLQNAISIGVPRRKKQFVYNRLSSLINQPL